MIFLLQSVALPFPILEPEQVDRHELFANQLLELVTRVHDHPLGFIHLGAYFEDYVAKIRPLLDDSFAVATSLVEIAEKQTNPARKLLGYRLFLSIAQFIISNRPTDNEKERRIFALVEQLVTHKDQNVQALIIGHPNCFVRDIEQEEEDSSDSEYYSDSD